jgi:hypothetical protein
VSRPKFSHIPLDKIKVDPRYQREIIPTHLDRIRNEFDEAQLDVLQLSKRSPDEYACIDGQHRLIVLAERAVSGEGGDTAPSLVHEGLTPQEEADLFRLIQERRRQLTPLDKYKSRLFADDPIAKGIEVIAEEFELEIGTGPKSIQSIVNYERVYRRGNLHDTLSVMNIWRGDAKWLEGALCDGLSRFLILFPEADMGHAREKWAEMSPTMILRRAGDLMMSSKAGGVVEVLRAQYASRRFPLPSVQKAIEERKAGETQHGRTYRRVTLEEVRDAAYELAPQSGDSFTVHQIQEHLGSSRASLVKKGGFLDRLLDLGSFKRVRDGNGPYRFERVPPGKEQSRLIAQRKERSNGSGPRVGHSRAVPGTGKPKRRPGSRDVLPSAKR